MSRYIVHDDDGWAVSNKFRPIGWLLLNRLADRVTEAEFEVIEPTTSNDEQRDKSAGDGNSDHGPTIINRSYTIFTEPTTT